MRELSLDNGTFTLVVNRRSDSLDNAAASPRRGARAQLRSGVVLAVAVVAVVGIAGVLRWSQRLILTGLVAGLAIVGVTIVIALAKHWHHSNTALPSSHALAEDVVRLRRPRPSAHSRRKR